MTSKLYLRVTPLPVLYFLLSLGLAACSAPSVTQDQPNGQNTVASEADAQQSVSEGRALAAVRIYTLLAEQSDDIEQKQDYELKAIETLFDNGYPELAVDRIDTVSRPSHTPLLAQRRKIIETRGAVALGEPMKALELLPEDTSDLAPDLRVRAEEARAQAYTALADAENALLTRISLEQLLDDEWLIDRNHQLIWQLLENLPDIELASLVSFGRGSTYQGWIDLAQTVQNTRQQNGQLENTVRDWQRRYALHPASQSFALSLIQQSAQPSLAGEQIAFLLPLSGKLSELAGAVRDGIFAAFYADTGGLRPNLRIYDIGDASDADVMQHYSRAISDGAKAIIGPLNKADIEQLANAQALPVPTLGLNYASEDIVAPPENLFQFGLLPEDEAYAVADFAIEQGHTRALGLVPDSPWGHRLINAFNRRFVEQGGRLLSHQRYPTEGNDFSGPIRQLLNLSYSRSRKAVLQSTLANKLEFEPYRRQDTDFIFLAASPRFAQQIKPQLKFHHAGDLPVVSTSRANRGITQPDQSKDMEGLYFCDIPWLLDDARASSNLFRNVSAHWPQQGSLSRLYALGIDAYNLMPHLREMSIDASYRYPGRTGELTLEQNRRIRRHLRWAQIVEGQTVVVLPALPTAEQSLEQTPALVDG